MKLTAQTNIAEVLAELRRIRAKGEDLAPLFDELANALFTQADEALEKEQAPSGAAWKPLAERTIARKGHDRRLHDSGALRQTLDFFSDQNAATVGTSAVSNNGYPYPAVMQFGTEDGRVPARPFLPFDPEGDLMDTARDSLLTLARAHFERLFDAHG